MKTLRQRLAVWLIVGLLFSMVSCETTQPTVAHAPMSIEDAILDGPNILTREEDDFAKALAHYANGFVCYTKGQSDEALTEWAEVVTLDITRTDLRARMIQEYFRRGDFVKATQFLENAVQHNPKSVIDWNLLAVAYRANKQWEKAVQTAEKAIELSPQKFVGYEVLFENAIEKQDLKAAKKILDRASRQKSDEYQFWVRLGDLSQALGARDPKLGITIEKVIEYYDRAVALQPTDIKPLVDIADFFAGNKQLDKAIGLYQKVLSLEPNAENVRLKLALGHVAQGDKGNAISILEQVVKREPMRFQVFTLIGELYEDSKDYDQAMSNYRLSLSANPNQLMPYLKMALLNLKAKKVDEALTLLDKAHEKFPNVPQVSYFYGLAYSEKKEFTTAIRFFEEAVKQTSNANATPKDPSSTTEPVMESSDAGGPSNQKAANLDSVFYFYYASALERAGQFDKAVELFRKAIEMNPDYAEAYNYLGFMFAEKNIHLEESLKLIERALSFEPENGAYLDSLGWVYYRLGRYQEAIVPLLKAVSQPTGNDPTVLDHVGDVYRKLGDMREALNYYQRALKLDSKNAEIQSKIDDVSKAVSSNGK